jgi:hypothetical protein
MKNQHSFKPGNTFGKGRPSGSRNKNTFFLDALGEENLKPIVDQLVEQALSGDVKASKIVLDYVYPTPKALTYVNIDELHTIQSQKDVDVVMARILKAVASGELALEHGAALTDLVIVKKNLIDECILAELIEIKKTLGLSVD